MAVSNIIAELKALVEQATHERELQDFLERYPWLLVSQHIDPNFVISQFPLGVDHRCDFAYFFQWSRGDFLRLVEIESPRLNIFSGEKDDFSAPFNHAIQQLEDWDGWCRRNADYIVSLLEPLFDSGYITGLPSFSRVQLLLIAGRRAQLSSMRRRRRWEERVNRAPKNTEIRTWEEFIESLPIARFESVGGATDILCLRYSEQGCREIHSTA